MTQEQAAALHCVSARTVSGWEAGAAMDPRTPVICAAWDWLQPERRKQLFTLAGRLAR